MENRVGSAVAERLRQAAERAIAGHQYSSAAFWTDKAASLSGDDPAFLFSLAEAYMKQGQFHRAAHLLSARGLVAKHPSCKYLTGRCHAEVEEWEEALEVLGAYGDGREGAGEFDEAEGFSPIANVGSCIQLLRGKVYEALDNRARAAACYTAALRLDVYCYEAFERLVVHHMLSAAEERELLAELPFDAQCGEDAALIKFLYGSKLKKYGGPPPEVAEYAAGEAISGNAEVRVAVAEQHYYDCDFSACYASTSAVLDADPFHHACLPIHLACQLELRDTNGLFYMAHKLVDSYPEKAVAWFAVGCYYYLVGNSDEARRYFGRASRLDIHFGPAWLGFGHAFAAEGEHDQATSAYCTAARLLSGCHLPILFMGMEYLATGSAGMAREHLERANRLCPADPAVVHELGVLAFRSKDFVAAKARFEEAVALCTTEAGGVRKHVTHPLDATLQNLARAQHKLRQYADAAATYRRVLAIAPRSAAAYAGLAHAHQCLGENDRAIDCYHKALARRPGDTFSAQMLKVALEDALAPRRAQLDVGAPHRVVNV